MQDFEITPTQLILFNVGLGFVIGLIPLVLGLVKKRMKLGILAVVVCTVAGLILGIYLALPAAAVFVYLIFKKASAGAVIDASGSEPS